MDDLKRTMRLIDKQLNHEGELIEKLVRAHAMQTSLWYEARPGLKEGELSREDCAEMARLWNEEFHPASETLNYGGRITHQLMSLIVPPGANEGPKECEPYC